MKTFLLFGLLLSSVSSWTCEPTHHLVSDMDDTIKITDVSSARSAIWNAIFSHRSFPGMGALYTGIVKELSCGDQFSLVTGSPRILKFRADKFLSEGEFPPADLYFRQITEQSTEVHKDMAIKRIAQQVELPLLLIGDNTQHDSDIYQRIVDENYDIDGVWIRGIRNQTLPYENQTLFLTAFELAYDLYKRKLLSQNVVKQVGVEVMNSVMAFLMPDFAYCPEELWLEENESMPFELEAMQARIQNQVITFCEIRQS